MVALLGGVAALPRVAALAQDNPPSVGLPQGSKVGTVHRDATNHIVAEPPNAAPSGPAAPAGPYPLPKLSPPAAPRAGATPLGAKPAAARSSPGAKTGPEHPAAAVTLEKAVGPEGWDDASCKAYQWEASLKYDECRKSLAEARAQETHRGAP